MALPSVLKHFMLFNDGNSYQGIVEEIKLPKLSRKMDGYRGGGMSGEAKIDLGQNALEAEVICGGLVAQMFQQYAAAKIDAVMLRFAGSYQEDQTGQTLAVEVVMRGRWEEIDPDNAKGGDKTKFTGKAALTYYKETIAGKETLEIDIVNMIEKVNGVDMLAEHRKNIGLA
jgi:P2 family phage contractile tail tube protein